MEDFEEIERDIKMVPVKIGNVIQMEDIFFEVNKADIKPESFPELDRVAEFLVKNPYIEIEIGGHTTNLCGESFCVKLSESRAKAVADYLTKKGVAEMMISYKGYGSKKPIADNSTKDGRKANQRVEFKIVGL